MGYLEALAYLDALGVDSMKKLAPSTQRMEALCDLLNNPERAVPAIHITGTNGKSSTARITTSLLTAAGLSVGTYTSPHLQSPRERLAINGEPIAPAVFGELFDHIKPYVETVEAKLGEPISYFELLTGMFFLMAAETPVDAMVVEVGLGGRWDATNFILESVPVITNVNLDHTQMLGATTLEIAAEKVGIVKEGATLVTAERVPDVLQVLAAQAPQIARIGRDFDVIENRVAFGGRYLSLRSSAATYEGLFLPLHGAHQGVNAATALEAVTRFIPARAIAADVVAEGLSTVTTRGRLESSHFEGSVVPIVLDVAHNPAGMSAMISSLVEAFAFERAIFVVGVLADKDHEGIMSEIARVEGTVITCEARSSRSVPAEQLAEVTRAFGIEAEALTDVRDALDRARELAGEADLICVTGSHYVVGEARDVLLPSEAEKKTDMGKR
jgi:dihydrofolate synthase/folylpolyglutamate synthase